MYPVQFLAGSGRVVWGWYRVISPFLRLFKLPGLILDQTFYFVRFSVILTIFFVYFFLYAIPLGI